MWLERIAEPGDLDDLTEDQLTELAGEIRDFIVAAVAETRRPPRLQPRRGRADARPAPRVRVAPRRHPVGHRPPGLRPQARHRAAGRLRRAAPGRRPVRLPLARGEPRTTSSRTATPRRSCRTPTAWPSPATPARDPHRHIVAVIGDGSMTGGMAYEALNNLGHSQRRVIIVLNDNGRSYAPTVSNLTAERPRRRAADRRRARRRSSAASASGCRQLLTEIRLNPVYVRRQRTPRGAPARRARSSAPRPRRRVEAFKAAVREFLQPPAFFEALGVRYVGPVDGHDIAALEPALRNAVELSAEGPIVVHVLTQKGRGYPPAEDDDEKHLHDAPGVRPADRPAQGGADRLHAGVRRGDHQGGRGRRPHRRDHRGDGRPDRPAAVPGPLPRPLLRRRHRRAARRHRRRRHGDGRPAPGRGDLLDVPQPGLGPGRLRRRPAPPARWCSASTAPASPAPTGRATTACTTWRCSPGCPGMRVLAPSSAQELQQMLARRDERSPTAARSPSATRGARPARSASTRSASASAARQVRAPRATGRRACACWPSASWSRRPRRPPTSSPPRASTSTVWDVRCCAPLDADMLADAAAPPGRRDVRGRRPRRRHRHDDRRPHRRHRARPCRSRCSASPTRFIPHDGRARARSWPSSASTPTASPPPSAGCSLQ